MDISSRLVSIAESIRSAPVSKAPLPWRFVAEVPVGGLWAVGFDEQSEDLLVVSSSGQGLVDCVTGIRVARNVHEDGYDRVRLRATLVPGVGIREFRMSGLHGGGLPTVTQDLWSISEETLNWPYRSLLLFAPDSDLFGGLYDKRHDFTKLAIESEVRAFGFSWSGQTLIIATTSELKIYNRSRIAY